MNKRQKIKKLEHEISRWQARYALLKAASLVTLYGGRDWVKLEGQEARDRLKQLVADPRVMQEFDRDFSIDEMLARLHAGCHL